MGTFMHCNDGFQYIEENSHIKEYVLLIPYQLFFAEISNKIVANVSSGGVMEITAPNEADLKAIDWNKVINMPAYKLYIEVFTYPTTCLRQQLLVISSSDRSLGSPSPFMLRFHRWQVSKNAVSSSFRSLWTWK